MRQIKISPDEYYHVFNRGVNKQTIFHNAVDYARFLFLILYFQSPINFPQISRIVNKFTKSVKSSAFDTGDEDKIVKDRTVELVAFNIMPNHFHLIIKEVEEGGITAYMQRVLTAYSKYYNAKYGKSGHVFQGPYGAVHIGDDRQLLHLSAYIHRNARELNNWLKREDQYPWASYQDFISTNRWGGLLARDIVLGQFKDSREYHKFVKTSLAKVLKEELDYLEDL